MRYLLVGFALWVGVIGSADAARNRPIDAEDYRARYALVDQYIIVKNIDAASGMLPPPTSGAHQPGWEGYEALFRYALLALVKHNNLDVALINQHMPDDNIGSSLHFRLQLLYAYVKARHGVAVGKNAEWAEYCRSNTACDPAMLENVDWVIAQAVRDGQPDGEDFAATLVKTYEMNHAAAQAEARHERLMYWVYIGTGGFALLLLVGTGVHFGVPQLAAWRERRRLAVDEDMFYARSGGHGGQTIVVKTPVAWSEWLRRLYWVGKIALLAVPVIWILARTDALLAMAAAFVPLQWREQAIELLKLFQQKLGG